MVDAQVAADAHQPGLKIRAPIERVQRLEDLEENVLGQVFGFVVAAGELVGDVEHFPPMLPDDLFPRALVAAEAALDKRIDRISGDGRVGHVLVSRERPVPDSKSYHSSSPKPAPVAR
jgi:hypothetical protein